MSSVAFSYFQPLKFLHFQHLWVLLKCVYQAANHQLSFPGCAILLGEIAYDLFKYTLLRESFSECITCFSLLHPPLSTPISRQDVCVCTLLEFVVCAVPAYIVCVHAHCPRSVCARIAHVHCVCVCALPTFSVCAHCPCSLCVFAHCSHFIVCAHLHFLWTSCVLIPLYQSWDNGKSKAGHCTLCVCAHCPHTLAEPHPVFFIISLQQSSCSESDLLFSISLALCVVPST